MNKIDFSKLGGYPLCQDDLEYMQDGITNAMLALFAGLGNGPYIISGCAVTVTLVTGTTYNTSITSGWIYYNGDIIPVTACSLNGVDLGVNGVYAVVTNSDVPNPLAFENGSAPDVLISSAITGLVAQVAGTADDATHFLLSEAANCALMPNHTSAYVVGVPNGQTVTFTRPQFINYSALAPSGVSTINLDSAGAKEGCEVIIWIVCSVGAQIVFNMVSPDDTFTVMNGTGNLTATTGSYPMILKIKYVKYNVILGIFLIEAHNGA